MFQEVGVIRVFGQEWNNSGNVFAGLGSLGLAQAVIVLLNYKPLQHLSPRSGVALLERFSIGHGWSYCEGAWSWEHCSIRALWAVDERWSIISGLQSHWDGRCLLLLIVAAIPNSFVVVLFLEPTVCGGACAMITFYPNVLRSVLYYYNLFFMFIVICYVFSDICFCQHIAISICSITIMPVSILPVMTTPKSKHTISNSIHFHCLFWQKPINRMCLWNVACNFWCTL